MADFALPHDHGRHKHDEALHRELMNTERFSAVADVFKQLSDPVRVRIFWLLSHREECVINIAAMMDMSSPAVSHHLKSLLDSGLIMSRRDGKEVSVQVGSVIHPMLEEHYIQIIAAAAGDTVTFKLPKPGDEPVLKVSSEAPVTAYELCNLHGFWKGNE